MAGKKRFIPGEVAETSGQYKNTTTQTEVTVVEGKRIPPTPGPDQHYVLVDPTKHKK